MNAAHLRRLLASLGALFCALAVILGAAASHAAPLAARPRLDTAALYLFLHGVALLALSPRLRARSDLVAGGALAIGTLLFCGSLGYAAVSVGRPLLAPWGGAILIAAWLLMALQAWRRRDRD